MGAAAEFHAEIPGRNNPYHVAVFFAEQSHCPKLAGLLNGHFTAFNKSGIHNLLVHKGFDCCYFAGGHGRKMSEVKP